ncbi:hypothetical protein D3C76_986270 [compost metagenome]
MIVDAAAGALTAEQQATAFGQAESDIALHRLAVRGADQRAHLCRFVSRVTQAQTRCPGHQALHERRIQGAGDEQPRTGNAGLARGAEDAVQHSGHGVIEVGVIEDDGRRLAAQLQRHRHHLVGGDMGDVLAGFGPAGERHTLDQRVLRQRITEQ